MLDVFDMTSWNTTPSNTNFTYLVNKSAVKKSPKKSGNGEANALNEGVVEFNPLFFGEDD